MAPETGTEKPAGRPGVVSSRLEGHGKKNLSEGYIRLRGLAPGFNGSEAVFIYSIVVVEMDVSRN